MPCISLQTFSFEIRLFGPIMYFRTLWTRQGWDYPGPGSDVFTSFSIFVITGPSYLCPGTAGPVRHWIHWNTMYQRTGAARPAYER